MQRRRKGRDQPAKPAPSTFSNRHLDVLANLLPESGFLFGARPRSTDAGVYGFTANIYFYDIDTPLKTFLLTRPNLVAHCRALHSMLDS